MEVQKIIGEQFNKMRLLMKNPSYGFTIRIAFYLILFLSGWGVASSISLYRKVYSPNVGLLNADYTFVYIPTNSTYSDVKEILFGEGILVDRNSFDWLAKKKKYPTQVKAGRFEIRNGLNNNQLINILRSGRQKPIRLTINNARTLEELARKVSKKIEADSASIVEFAESEEFKQVYKLNKLSAISLVIPNTYEFFWNTSAKQFYSRMHKEYRKFWNAERKNKAEKIGLKPIEVSTLASIVQAEQSLHNDEKAKIAGLYMNRIRKNYLLQSDPTIVFAIGDFSIKRVLNRDKLIDSPYNTYKNRGLPPGPINMPDVSSIDAVLNFENHDYLYMCAKEDFSGYHNFSKTNRQHVAYAKKYQRALSKRRIYR